MASPRLHEGKLALITGSARGIGAAIARNLASKGCNIIINHVSTASDARAAALAADLAATHHVRAVTVRADISTATGCADVINTAKDAFSSPSQHLQIDILVHNAAVLYLGPLDAGIAPADFHHIYAVNVLGPTLLTAACTPFLPTDRSGRIIVLSSVNAKTGLAGTTLYSGTKGALEASARVWARELAERATVNTLNVGPVMTDMYMTAPDEVKQSLALWNQLTPLTPVRDSDPPEVQEMGRKFGGRPAYETEIAGMVAMLCNPESGWCTGSSVNANGGQVFNY